MKQPITEEPSGPMGDVPVKLNIIEKQVLRRGAKRSPGEPTADNTAKEKTLGADACNQTFTPHCGKHRKTCQSNSRLCGKLSPCLPQARVRHESKTSELRAKTHTRHCAAVAPWMRGRVLQKPICTASSPTVGGPLRGSLLKWRLVQQLTSVPD